MTNTKVDWTFVHRMMSENNRRLSRTHKGHSDTGSSEHKQPLLLAGRELLDRLEKNEVDVAKFVQSQCQRRSPDSANEVQELLFHVADLTNRGIVPGNRFRTWRIAADQASLTGGPAISGPEAKVPPQKIEEAVYDFAGVVLSRWPELAEDPVPLAAWAEWQLNGGCLHPFYDGCGRISRSFAATLLVTANSLLPLFDDSANYFAAGNRGLASFIGYYSEKIEACKRWMGRL